MTRNENLTTVGLFATFMLAGCAFGLFFFGQPIDVNLPIQPAPTPAVAPVDRDLVVGLSEVLVDVHKEATATKAQLQAVRAEATQIIKAMIAEIQRLQSRPTIHSGDKTAEAGPTLAPPF